MTARRVIRHPQRPAALAVLVGNHLDRVGRPLTRGTDGICLAGRAGPWAAGQQRDEK